MMKDFYTIYENYLNKLIKKEKEENKEEYYGYVSLHKDYRMGKSSNWLIKSNIGIEENFYKVLQYLMNKNILNFVSSSYKYNDYSEIGKFILTVQFLPITKELYKKIKSKFKNNLYLDKSYVYGSTYNKNYSYYFIKDKMEELLKLRKINPFSLTRAEEISLNEYLIEKEKLEDEIKNNTLMFYYYLEYIATLKNGNHWDIYLKLLKENFL